MSTISKKIFAIVTTLTLSVLLVGPVQAVTIEELMAQITALTAQLAQLQQQTTGGTVSSSACTGITFSRNLIQGMSGTDVKCLQAILNSSADTQVSASGVGSAGSETLFFGALTKVAVVKFQVKNAATILTPLGLTQGTGFVGASTRTKLTSLVGAVSTTPTTPGGGTNTVGLSSDSPAATTIAKGAQDVIFSKMNFCAASVANTVSKIILTRAGLAADTDFAYIKLFDGATQVGATQALNQSTHKASFGSLSVVIPANSCKVLTVKASISQAATTGNTPKLAINAASDITSTVALDGVFPILSSGMTVAGISVGDARVEAQTTPSGSIIAGGVDQAVASFKFTASSSEGIKINSITFREVGSSVDSDISNIKLFYGSAQLGSTVASLNNGLATFDISSAPVEILTSGSKTLTLYIDLGTSNGVSSRTVKFEITQYTDVTVYGTNSGGTVVAVGGAAAAADTWPQSGASMTVVLGTLTIAQDSAYSPSAQTYVIGTVNNTMNAFKFSTGAYEGVRVTQIKLHATGTGAGTVSNVANVGLYDIDGTLIAGPVGMISSYVTFGSYTSGLDATGLFDIAKSSFKTVVVKADIPSGATAGNTIGFEILLGTSTTKADGLVSQNDLASTDISAAAVIPATGVKHTISGYGTVTVSLGSASPAGATYALGTTNYTLGKFDFTSTGEDIIISQINILLATSANPILIAAVGDVNNVKLSVDGTTIATDPTISSGFAQFGVNLTIPKNTTKSVSVIADIPAASAVSGLRAAVGTTTDIVSVGKDSGVSTTTQGSFTVWANQMTKGAPTVTVTAATLPVSKTYIKGTSLAHVATFYFTAGTAEDIKITSIKLVGDASDTNATSSFATSTITDILLSTYMSNVKLFDGSTQVGTTQPTWTDNTNYDYVTFSGLSLTIPKGTTKSIDVKLDVLNSTATKIFVGFSASTDINGNGVNSGQTATITMQGGGIAGKTMTLGAAGSLAVQLDTNSPVSAQVVEGTAANEFGRWKFTATNEHIMISKLIFNVIQSSAATGTSVGAGAISTSTAAGVANNLATSGASFLYYLNGATASNTCTIATSSNQWGTAADIAAEMKTDCGLVVTASASNVLTITTSTLVYSIAIADYPTASNSADNLLLGLGNGGVETIGTYAGSNDSLAMASLYSGTTLLATAPVGTEQPNKIVFNFSSGSEIDVNDATPKVLSIKLDLSAWQGSIEGSTMEIDLGSTSSDYVDLITAEGGSSGTTLAKDGGIISSVTSATGTVLAANAMYLYATKPTVSLASSSPSSSGLPSTNETVFKFDVTSGNAGFDLNINSIRFTLSSNSTSSAQTFNDGVWYLYKSTDLATAIGSATPFVATDTVAYGYLNILPLAGFTVGNSATTYVLKGYTAGMNISPTAAESLTISIAAGDLYWDDSASVTGAANANQKTLNLPVTGGSLSY